MGEQFDPYHRWLGIRPEEQPADHYRLLGLARFEDDPEVIRDAAERQIRHVRSYQLGQHRRLSQKILNELAAAKACLLDDRKRVEYDERLHQAATVKKKREPPPLPPRVEPSPTSTTVAPMPNAPIQRGKPAVSSTVRSRVSTDRRRRGLPSRWRSPVALGAAAAGGLAALVLVLLLVASRSSKDASGGNEEQDVAQPGGITGTITLGNGDATWPAVEQPEPKAGEPKPDIEPEEKATKPGEKPHQLAPPGKTDDAGIRKSSDATLAELFGPAPTPRPDLAEAPFDEVEAKRHQGEWAEHLGVKVEITNSIGMKLVLIPPGEFKMGSPEPEERRGDQEHQHHVRLTKAFCLCVYEVTQSECEKVMGRNPSRFSSVPGEDTSQFPVETVSWDDAVEFCRKLSSFPAERSAGRVYRLPTEAEWEYACRGGTTTPFHFGTQLNGREANCNGNYPYGTSTKGPDLDRTTTAGSYKANAFGLYDMHGNVWEWCQDGYDGEYYRNSPTEDPQGSRGASRVVRGGGWSNDARYVRSAYRSAFHPGDRDDVLGFRCALVLPSK